LQELRAWNPEAPEGEWRLAWKGDTEDGPYAWFVRPMALRPEPVALAATGKQVGEEQGDALATIIAALEHSKPTHAHYPEPVKRHADALAHARALAARQPGAQAPGWSGWATQKPGQMLKLWGTREVAELNHDLTGDARLIFLSEQTAQGIDLHRLVPPEWLSELIGGQMDDLTPGQAWRQGFNQCRERTLLLVEQVLGFPADQRRDAAPGVGNG
jgi:hypothetical protein